MFCMLLFNFVNYVLLWLWNVFLLLRMFCFGYSVSLCCSVYCLCVNVYCTTANGCQPNCSKQLYHILSLQPLCIQTSILFLEQSEHTSWQYRLNIPDILFIWRNFRMFYRNTCWHIATVFHPPVSQDHKIPAGYNTTTSFLRNLVADISMSIYYLINRNFTY